jgi:hypothetical protein
MRSSDQTLIKALCILSEDIDSEDGIANMCIVEAAQRLEELVKGITEVLYDNRHLADGEDCSLIKLKKLINFEFPTTEEVRSIDRATWDGEAYEFVSLKELKERKNETQNL